ncbi:MAG: IclR family transcriptional regulator [Anaerolineae bacterium]|nr:IclR family transcriptional regulator [Anaerolineae bacterium]
MLEPEKPSAVDRALDVLLLFRDGRTYASVDEISHALDIPRSTVYRYVRILSDKGLLERTGAAHYRLGLALLELGRYALASNRDIRLTALPSMKRLAEDIGESVSLMRIFDRHVICIESIEGRHALRVTIEQGRTQALHAGASSKILLAHLPESEWDGLLELPLRRFTANTTTDIDTLKAQLRQIRQEGYCVSDGEIDVGARAIAVPLWNLRREVIAALSIEAPASRMDERRIAEYREKLAAEARAIHQSLD